MTITAMTPKKIEAAGILGGGVTKLHTSDRQIYHDLSIYLQIVY